MEKNKDSIVEETLDKKEDKNEVVEKSNLQDEDKEMKDVDNSKIDGVDNNNNDNKDDEEVNNKKEQNKESDKVEDKESDDDKKEKEDEEEEEEEKESNDDENEDNDKMVIDRRKIGGKKPKKESPKPSRASSRAKKTTSLFNLKEFDSKKGKKQENNKKKTKKGKKSDTESSSESSESSEEEKPKKRVTRTSSKEITSKKKSASNGKSKKKSKDSDSDEETPKSRTRGKKGKSMKEVDTDADESEEEENEKTDQEKENNSNASNSEGEDEDENNDFCEECKDGGTLLCCSTCPRSYHLNCLDPPLTREPPADVDWFCPMCCCPICGSGQFDENKDSKKYQKSCERCERNFHKECAKFEKKRCPECIKWPGAAEQILTHKEDKDERPTDYYIKWKERSHIHDCWVPHSWLSRVSTLKLQNYNKRPNNRPQEISDVVQPEWCEVERVVAVRDNDDDKPLYLVKWTGLGYDQCTWESDTENFKEQLKKFEMINKRKPKPITEPERKQENFMELKNQPPTLQGQLLSYQLEGLNWLLYSWFAKRNAILADEMGLGKTIQSISFLTHLYEAYGLSPFLLVVPLSTVTNWSREFATWSPQMNAVPYIGSSDARKMIRENEFYMKTDKKDKKDKQLKFNALITSYEILLTDNTYLKKIPWRVLIVDEGHRLKNNEAKLFQYLKDYHTEYRVLLTGTPIQNNIEELINLFDFLGIDSVREFGEEAADSLHTKEQLEKLHQVIRPHMLRRVKQDVLKSLPKKAEIVVPVSMSPFQKSFYQAILTRNYQYLNGSKKMSSKKVSLINILSQLLKCCNHPYLFENEPETSSKEEEHKRLVEASAKLYLLDKMLEKLKKQGNRVLIFSQSTRVLDILEDYLTYKNHNFVRIDGQVAVSNRQAAIDKFNNENSSVFCFLLSTRACRLGINLASADTVVFYDSDWNPHNDIQALSRAHRIGQTKTVMIYRLITRNSAEERVLQTANKKLVLEHLVVKKMDQELNSNELEDILKYGTAQLFNEKTDENEEYEFEYDDAALDKLLDRSQATEEVDQAEDEKATFLRSFNKARVWDVTSKPVNVPTEQLNAMQTDDYWRNLLHDRYLELLQEEEAVQTTAQKRVRKQVVKLDYGVSSSDSESSEEEKKPKKTKNKGKKQEVVQEESEEDDDWAMESNDDEETDPDSDFSSELIPEGSNKKDSSSGVTGNYDGSSGITDTKSLLNTKKKKKRKGEDDDEGGKKKPKSDGVIISNVTSNGNKVIVPAVNDGWLKQRMILESVVKRFKEKQSIEQRYREETSVAQEIYTQQYNQHKELLKQHEAYLKQQHKTKQQDYYVLEQEIAKQKEAYNSIAQSRVVTKPNGTKP